MKVIFYIIIISSRTTVDMWEQMNTLGYFVLPTIFGLIIFLLFKQEFSTPILGRNVFKCIIIVWPFWMHIAKEVVNKLLRKNKEENAIAFPANNFRGTNGSRRDFLSTKSLQEGGSPSGVFEHRCLVPQARYPGPHLSIARVLFISLLPISFIVIVFGGALCDQRWRRVWLLWGSSGERRGSFWTSWSQFSISYTSHASSNASISRRYKLYIPNR